MADNSPDDLLASLQDIKFVTIDGSNLPGVAWWVLGGVLLLALLLSMYFYWRLRNKNHYRKVALSLLKQASVTDHSDSDKLLAYNAIVKRAALTVFPDEGLDRLYGRQWLEFLNKHTRKTFFSPQLIESWHKDQFSKDSPVDASAFYKSCQCWLKQHQTGKSHV